MNRPNLFTLERLVAGDLAAEEERVVLAAVRADPDLLATVEAIREADAHVRRRWPARPFLDGVERRQRRRRTRAIGGAAVVVALAAGLFLAFRATPPSAPEIAEVTRVKGDPALLVFREGREAAPLTSGAVAAPGDRVQLAFEPAGHPYGVLLSVDGRGSVTLHHPRAGRDTRLGGGTVLLDRSFELDDAPTFERFVLVLGDAPLDVDAVVAAASDLPDPMRSSLDLPDDAEQIDFLLRKSTSGSP
ncbi:MAG: hypothetical protein H6738_21625 [Alphaproteobacteria bacterium]|nr:hypothetical protein [Alphaproteobacteria bacterium]MCB9699397.1 hypothetical protein [Alphaproteobacteria bacterium]